jgi:hypothetical protein
MICENFKEDDNCYTHKCETKTEPTYGVMFNNDVGAGETCAVIVTEDELALLLTNSTVASTFTFIGEHADAWEDDEFRNRVCDKALEFIEEQKNN